jgi:hypothetical protein
MDLYCSKCREPWDNDSLHDLVEEGKFSSYDEAYKAFVKNGCEIFDSSHGELMDAGRQNLVSELYDLLGDDSDGAMSMLDDADIAGLF